MSFARGLNRRGRAAANWRASRQQWLPLWVEMRIAFLSALGGASRSLAGFALFVGMILLVASLVRSILGAPFRPQLASDVSAREVANYTTERFTHEPELWRIHIRTIRGLLDSIESSSQMVDHVAATLRGAGLLFLAGLLGVAVALGILILEVTFR